jgi:hypothetical protein
MLSLTGCASTPPAPAAAAKAMPAAAPTSTAPTAAPALSSQEAAVKDALKNGYKVRVVNGNTQYCREETQIGSRLPQQTCLNPDQLYQAMKDRQASQDLWSHQTLCGGGGVSCGSK